MTTWDIVNHLYDVYGQPVSKAMVSRSPTRFLRPCRRGQNRHPEAVYPMIMMDCIFVKIRDSWHVRNRPIYIVMGITGDSERAVLGLWAGPPDGGEGARVWLGTLTQLKNRGVAVPRVKPHEPRATPCGSPDRVQRRQSGELACGHQRNLAQ